MPNKKSVLVETIQGVITLAVLLVCLTYCFKSCTIIQVEKQKTEQHKIQLEFQKIEYEIQKLKYDENHSHIESIA